VQVLLRSASLDAREHAHVPAWCTARVSGTVGRGAPHLEMIVGLPIMPAVLDSRPPRPTTVQRRSAPAPGDESLGASRRGSSLLEAAALPFELYHEGPRQLVACSDGFVFVIAHLLSRPGIEAMGRALAAAAQRRGTISSLSVVPPQASVSRLDARDRELYVEISRRYARQVTAAAVVVEGTGFKATAIRSVVTAIQMASGSSRVSKVFADTTQALAWVVSKQPAGGVDSAALMQTYVALRGRFEQAELEPHLAR